MLFAIKHMSLLMRRASFILQIINPTKAYMARSPLFLDVLKSTSSLGSQETSIVKRDHRLQEIFEEVETIRCISGYVERNTVRYASQPFDGNTLNQ